MKGRALIFATAILTTVFATACAESSDSTLIVDLEAVVADGRVAPIDGIRTAGQPSEAALKVFADNGFKTIIDIRGKREKRGFDEKAAIELLGMSYVTMPVTGAASINFDNARKLNQLIEEADGPVLVHCGSGNRVGALLALGESIEGASDDLALKVGKSAGLTRLESRVREVLEKK